MCIMYISLRNQNGQHSFAYPLCMHYFFRMDLGLLYRQALQPTSQLLTVIKVTTMFSWQSSLHSSLTWNFLNMQLSLLHIHHYMR
jgi:hypothetical protein